MIPTPFERAKVIAATLVRQLDLIEDNGFPEAAELEMVSDQLGFAIDDLGKLRRELLEVVRSCKS